MPLLIINYLWVNDLLLDLSDPKDDGDKDYQVVSFFPHIHGSRAWHSLAVPRTALFSNSNLNKMKRNSSINQAAIAICFPI